MNSLAFLASSCADKQTVLVGEPLPGVACALTAGEGPSRNPKHCCCEDSVAVVLLPAGGCAAFVADSHWGARASEVLVDAAVAEVVNRAPTIGRGEQLAEWLLELDARMRPRRPVEDRSETTLLAAIVRGRRLVYASVADSHLYVLAGAPPLARRINTDRPLFAGAPIALSVAVGRLGRRAVLDFGEADLGPGELVLLASDGIAEEDSGMTPEEIARELHRPGPLVERVRALAERGRSAKHGGGRDNLGFVAIDPDALAAGSARG